MSAMQSTPAASAAKTMRETQKVEAKDGAAQSRPRENFYSTNSYARDGSGGGKPSTTVQRERPTTNPEFVPPERTSSSSFKAPATGKKKPSTPEPPPNQGLSSAFDIFSFPVKFITSKFSTPVPTPEPEKVKKFKIDMDNNSKRPQKTAKKPVEKPKVEEPTPSPPPTEGPSPTRGKDTTASSAEATAATGDGGLPSNVPDITFPIKTFSPPLKTASKGYVTVNKYRASSPSPRRPVEKKSKGSSHESESRLFPANSVNIAPSNKISYRVTSKNREEEEVKAKKDPRKVFRTSYSKTPSLTSCKHSARRDLNVPHLSEKQDDITFPTFLRQTFPPSYTVKTISSPDIPDRSNSASTDVLQGEALINNLPRTPKESLTDLYAGPGKSLSSHVATRGYKAEAKPLEEPVYCNLGPTFLGPTMLSAGNRRANSMMAPTPKWKEKIYMKKPEKSKKKSNSAGTSPVTSPRIPKYKKEVSPSRSSSRASSPQKKKKPKKKIIAKPTQYKYIPSAPVEIPYKPIFTEEQRQKHLSPKRSASPQKKPQKSMSSFQQQTKPDISVSSTEQNTQPTNQPMPIASLEQNTQQNSPITSHVENKNISPTGPVAQFEENKVKRSPRSAFSDHYRVTSQNLSPHNSEETASAKTNSYIEYSKQQPSTTTEPIYFKPTIQQLGPSEPFSGLGLKLRQNSPQRSTPSFGQGVKRSSQNRPNSSVGQKLQPLSPKRPVSATGQRIQPYSPNRPDSSPGQRIQPYSPNRPGTSLGQRIQPYSPNRPGSSLEQRIQPYSPNRPVSATGQKKKQSSSNRPISPSHVPSYKYTSPKLGSNPMTPPKTSITKVKPTYVIDGNVIRLVSPTRKDANDKQKTTDNSAATTAATATAAATTATAAAATMVTAELKETPQSQQTDTQTELDKSASPMKPQPDASQENPSPNSQGIVIPDQSQDKIRAAGLASGNSSQKTSQGETKKKEGDPVAEGEEKSPRKENDANETLGNYAGNPSKFVSEATMLGEMP